MEHRGGWNSSRNDRRRRPRRRERQVPYPQYTVRYEQHPVVGGGQPWPIPGPGPMMPGMMFPNAFCPYPASDQLLMQQSQAQAFQMLQQLMCALPAMQGGSVTNAAPSSFLSCALPAPPAPPAAIVRSFVSSASPTLPVPPAEISQSFVRSASPALLAPPAEISQSFVSSASPALPAPLAAKVQSSVSSALPALPTSLPAIRKSSPTVSPAAVTNSLSMSCATAVTPTENSSSMSCAAVAGLKAVHTTTSSMRKVSTAPPTAKAAAISAPPAPPAPVAISPKPTESDETMDRNYDETVDSGNYSNNEESDENQSENGDSDCILVQGDSSKCGLYLPGKSNPDDVSDEKPASAHKANNKRTGVKGSKKGTVHKSTVSKLKKEAEKFFGTSSSKSSSRSKTQTKPQTRSNKQTVQNELFAKLDKAQAKVSDTLRAAYSRSKTSQQDLEDIAALKAAGVLLPNGFVPMTPFYSEEGESFLEQSD